ncbi:MAG: O-antigen ligase family protein [Bacteroidetes bacterium]|nr:O-antigen ligase family protein [Bacteroidota bacterium]
MELGLGLTKIIPFIVYLGGIAILFVTLFYRIEFGIYFLIPLLTQQTLLDHLGDYPGGEDFIDLFFFVLLLKWLLNRQKFQKDPELRRPLSISIGAIFVWTFIGLLILSHTFNFPLATSNKSFIHWKNFLMLPLLYLIVVNNIKDEKQIKIILTLMAISMLYMDRSFYNNFANKDRSNFDESLRVGTTFSYLGPNETAVFYAQNSIIILSLFFFELHKRRKILLGVTVVFNYWCLVFLYSRGGYLAALVSFFFFGVTKDRRFLILLVLGLIFWQSFVPASVQQRIQMSTQGKSGIDKSIEERYDMWDQGWELIKQNPILGYGYYATHNLRIETAGDKKRASLHNGYMQLLLDLGVIGLGIFLIFFFICFRVGWRLFRTAEDPFLKGLGLGFAGCVLAVLAGNVAGSYWFYLNVSGFYWVNLGLVVRGLELAKESKLAEPKQTELQQRNVMTVAQ